MNEKEQKQIKKYEHHLESVQRKFDFLIKSIDNLDAKNGILFAAGIAAIGYLTALVIRSIYKVHILFGAFGVLGLILFAISMVILLKANHPREYDIPSIKSSYLEKSVKSMLRQSIKNTEGAVAYSEKILSKKITLYKISVILLVTATIFTSVYTIEDNTP